jgi:TolA-binding protein
MTTHECPQSPLVEGLFDGRLGPSEQASIERHLRTCKECSQRWHDLGQIRADLREITPPTPLAHQRARLGLLRAAAAPPPPARARRAWVLVALPILLLSVSVWAGTSLVWPARLPSITPPAPSALAPASAAPRGPGSASAAPEPSSAASGPSSAASGPASLAAPGGGPLAPVASGSVLAAGGVLPAALAPAAARSSWTAGRRGAGEASPGPREAASVAAPSIAPPVVSSVPPVAAANPSQEFADAMAALSQGDFSASARRMEGFSAAHPLDPRAEEAAYLDAIALERAGRRGEAQAAARRYLARYPGGAHRAQASKLAGAEGR